MQGQIVKHTTVVDWIKSHENTNAAQWNPVAQKLIAAAKQSEKK